MPSNESTPTPELTKHHYYDHVGKYFSPSTLKAVNSLVLTFLLFYVTFKLESSNYFIVFFCIVFRALLYVRLFIIMHDNGHESYFKGRFINDACGLFIASIIGINYFNWKKRHNYHHLISNDVRYTQEGQSAPFAVSYFVTLKPYFQKIYLALASKLGMVLVLPTFYRIINIVTMIIRNKGTLCCYLAVQYIKFSYFSFWTDQFSLELASFIGLLFFHVQHTFPNVKRKANISHLEQGLLGASYIELPEFLKFFSFGIEYHHIHHLNTKVPGYRLRQCHEDGELKDNSFWSMVSKVNLKHMIDFRYVLYDDKLDRLITREELKEFYGI